ncbi:hypothetical protein MHU86_8233 [Fragilaria crotonensis]|nr:hypothetical protein MHU86_8233 [Fragilaria crotonensis]
MQRYVLLNAARGLRVGAPRFLSSYGNITYSGGQATEGQGGYYGSGGSRVIEPPVVSGRSQLLALAADVERVFSVMEECQTLERLKERESDDGVSGKTIELRNSIRKLMTAPDFLESLGRLEVQGSPVWGLSASEREMIILAREKVNSS